MANNSWGPTKPYGDMLRDLNDATPIEVTRVIPPAELLGITTTPIVLIPALGPNKYAKLISAEAQFVAGSQAYVYANSLFFVPQGHLLSAIAGLEELLAGDNEDLIVDAVFYNQVLPVEEVLNNAILLTGESVDPTDGNGVLRVIFRYLVRSWP